jgi:hypothetical protein
MKRRRKSKGALLAPENLKELKKKVKTIKKRKLGLFRKEVKRK